MSVVTTTHVGGNHVGSIAEEVITPGDIVALQHGQYGRTEGLVVGSHVDYAGRTIVEVQLAPGDVYHAYYPTVQRVKRVVHHQPQLVAAPVRVAQTVPMRQRTVERHVYW